MSLTNDERRIAVFISYFVCSFSLNSSFTLSFYKLLFYTTFSIVLGVESWDHEFQILYINHEYIIQWSSVVYVVWGVNKIKRV